MLPQPFFLFVFSFMSQCIIDPVRAKGKPSLPLTGILAVNPTDATGFGVVAKYFGLNPHALFNAKLLSNDVFFLAGPAVGAPMAAICLEKLIVLGARRIVVYGWCGSLSPRLTAGALFVPTAGVSEEGTSSHYQDGGKRWHDEAFRMQLVDALAREGYPATQGKIWTTDAVYRETREKVERYSGQGVLAVDMEYTALNAVAAFRGVSLAAVMLVSDELYHRQWAPRFQRKQFRTASKRMLDRLCTLMHTGKLS